VKLRRPEDVGRFEWARMRLHTRIHRDLDDCPTCRSVEYERWMQKGGRLLRERLEKGDIKELREQAKRLREEAEGGSDSPSGE
jgi:hypothetical protein